MMTNPTHEITAPRPAVAKQRLRLIGTRPATDVESYDDVPWYRKQEYVNFPLLLPVMIVVGLTGDVFFEATTTTRRYSDASVWRYTVAAKAFFACVNVVVLAALISFIV